MSSYTYEVKSLNGYEAVQVFNRYRMGLLWNNHRDKLDPGQYKLLKSLWDNKLKGTLKCKTPIVYKLTKGKVGELGYGRYYGTVGSLEQFQRDIRATLCSEQYWDIDMVNCHPRLAIQISKKQFNKSMPMLEHYVNNRKECLDKFMSYGLSESDAKSVVIALINGSALQAKDDNNNYIYPEELRKDNIVLSIQKEVKQLIDDIISSNKHSDLYIHLVAQNGNYRGSFISLIYQTEERKCLDVMVAVLKAKGYVIPVLAYDGCMVLREGVGSVMPPSEILREIERAVKEHTDYDIQLKIKLMDDEVIPLAELEEVAEDGYAELKLEWESNHFYFKPTGTIVEETESGFKHYKIEHATEAFNMWKLKTKDADGNPLPFLKKWRNDTDRRIVEDFVYKLPEDCKPTEASIFKGFAYKRIEEEVSEEDKTKYINIFKSMMTRIVPEGEENKIYKALLKNFARLIQRPFERPDICIILRSTGHGVGKETLINTIKHIIGKNTAHYTSDEIFWDKHDTTKEGAILVHLEEAGMSNKKMADALKARITSEVQNIRPCGVSGYEVPNCALTIMTTNKECPVKIEASDRRFFIISIPEWDWGISDETEEGVEKIRLAKLAFWNEIYAVIKKPAFIKTIGEYLESIDLTGFAPRDFPMTEYKQSIMESSKTSEILFLEQWYSEDQKEGDYINVMYDNYKTFCINQSLPYKQSSNSFGQALVPLKKYFTKKAHKDTKRAVYLRVKPESK